MTIFAFRTGKKFYNAAGYRLAEKKNKRIHNPFMPNIASKQTVVIENMNGNSITICSYFNKLGKLVRRITNKEDSVKISDYEWFSPRKKIAGFKDRVLKQDASATLQNSGVRIKSTLTNFDTNERTDTFTCVDINLPTKTVTKSIGKTTINPSESPQFVITDESSIVETVKGKKTKEIYQISSHEKNEQPVNSITRTSGLTENEHKQILCDEYFYTRFKTPQDFIMGAKLTAFANQNIEQNTPVKITSKKMNCAAACTNDRILFSEKSVSQYPKADLAADLEHEAKHKYQKDLVLRWCNGELTNQDEIEKATAYCENFLHYIPLEKNIKANMEQLVEAEAYEVSKAVAETYRENTANLQKIYPHATGKTLGE